MIPAFSQKTDELGLAPKYLGGDGARPSSRRTAARIGTTTTLYFAGDGGGVGGGAGAATGVAGAGVGVFGLRRK